MALQVTRTAAVFLCRAPLLDTRRGLLTLKQELARVCMLAARWTICQGEGERRFVQRDPIGTKAGRSRMSF